MSPGELSDEIIRAYSAQAGSYDEGGNLASCWGVVARRALAHIRLDRRYGTVVEVGCGSGRALLELVGRARPGVEFIAVEPAAGMRTLASDALAAFDSVRVLDGRFEELPVGSASADYLFSILAFHWTTDLNRSVEEFARVLKPDGEMDLFFTGKGSGQEFTARTTPIFLKYMGATQLLKSAGLRKQLTKDSALELFQRHFLKERLTVEESFETHYDDLDGHWRWWVSRASGHFEAIPPDKRRACDDEVRQAIGALASEGRIPYTVHLLHVRLGS